MKNNFGMYTMQNQLCEKLATLIILISTSASAQNTCENRAVFEYCQYIDSVFEATAESNGNPELTDSYRSFNAQMDTFLDGFELSPPSMTISSRMKNFAESSHTKENFLPSLLSCMGRGDTNTRFGEILDAASSACNASATPSTPRVSTSDSICREMKQEENRIQKSMISLVAEYPGTNLVIGMCGGIAGGDSGSAEEAAVTFAGCAIIGCAMAGFGNCMDVSVKWFELGVKLSGTQESLKRNSCN